MGDNSIFSHASEAKLKTEIAKAREKIEVTFSHAKLLKHTDQKYNQDDYLDDLMEKEITNIKISDEIAIVDGYAFEIDRSEPKIGQYIGKEESLVFPEISGTVTLADDKKTATIHITAKETKNGISKIEIICDGHVIGEYTYDNNKEQIAEEYEVKQNGSYIIKVYAKLTARKTVEVDGIVMSIKYMPNGNEEYKKEHQVKISANETDDKVKSIKYQWLNTTLEPAEDTFIITCENEETITKNGVTGTYYLWTLLETEKGNKRIERSEGFKFDNEGPTISITSTPVSETSFKLIAMASDTKSGIAKYEFYVSDKLVDTQKITENSTTYIWSGTEMEEEKACSVKVIDKAGNSACVSSNARTKLHSWKIYGTTVTTKIEETVYDVNDYFLNRCEVFDKKPSAYLYGSGVGFKEESSQYVMYESGRVPGATITRKVGSLWFLSLFFYLR